MNAIELPEIPDSALCVEATEHTRAVSAPFLFNHVARTYVFGDALGRHRGLSYDRELLYLACVFHDLGLADSAPVETRFEVEGADAARAFLAARGVGAREQDIVWDAIALHTTVVIPQRKRPEIALCQMGAAIDVGYAPRTLLPERLVEEALGRYPRLGFKEAMTSAFCGLLRRNEAAAATSPVVADVGERRLDGFRPVHFCDVIAGAAFDE
ncbi:HD domain-containing protein [Sorangium sp. So ce281]|uniref:HD domain-containing protein n=1 Tax=unclassified Sorangium TaxID=2621164 RepID=UPI003F5F7B00